jgi:hypothetical protein
MSQGNPEVHLHFDIPSRFRGTFVVDSTTGAVTVTGLPDSGASVTVGTGGGLLLSDYPQGHLAEPMVIRHEKSGRKGTRSREMAIVLLSRGWTVKPGPKYLRWIFQGTTGKVTLYQNSKDILSRDDRAFMETVEGANPTANEVRWRYDADQFDNAVNAVMTIEAWAGGQSTAA